MDYAAELLAENRTFADLVFSADPETPVPTCPGWTFKHLYLHIGGGDRWAAQMVADRMTERLEFADIRDGRAPKDPDGARAWLLEGSVLLVDAAAQAPPGTEVWTFLGPKPPIWWVRRRLHEALVHRADAAIAVGAPFDVNPAVAADAVSEWLDIATARADFDSTLHLHATDDGLGEAGEWTVADGTWTHAHGKGDVALRGPAAELLLALTRRVQLADTSIELFGDEGAWQSWLSATPF